MASLCRRCAIRLQIAAECKSFSPPKRFLSSTPSTRKGTVGIPSFTHTPNPELNDVLASMREKHFFPAVLHNRERRLIFGTKNRQQLHDNPKKVTIGDEKFDLKWIDRRTEIPNRTKLLHQAVDLMAEERNWRNLPNLLAGMVKAKAVLKEQHLEKVVRLAGNTGGFGTILQCLHQAHNTGMTLKREEVLNGVIWGLHDMAQRDGWSEKATAKAIKDANEVATQLESEEHGSGKVLQSNDPRKRPDVLGVYLELSAVYAYKYQDGKDVDGKVKAYTERLLANINGAEQLKSTTPAPTGRQTEMLRSIPIWHGLYLALKVLGTDMPRVELATAVMQNYEVGLSAMAEAIEAQNPAPESYAGMALRAWRDCVRD